MLSSNFSGSTLFVPVSFLCDITFSWGTFLFLFKKSFSRRKIKAYCRTFENALAVKKLACRHVLVQDSTECSEIHENVPQCIFGLVARGGFGGCFHYCGFEAAEALLT